jgi:hypothetical protein
LQTGKIRRIYKILALLQKSGGFTKSWRSSKKSGGFTKSWHFSKSQADLKNIGVLQKNRRTIESWRALKSPRLVKNQRDWKKLVARLLFRLGGISSC